MNWSNFEIRFSISAEGELFGIQSAENTAAECTFSDGMLKYSMFYDYSEKPLCLTGRAMMGDAVRVRILPHRIELYVNEILADEEWPCGNHSFGNHTVTGVCEVEFSEAVPDVRKVLPEVIGTFQNAEGWKPEENVFVGDCMPHCHEGVYHVLYLKDRHHHRSKWGKGAHQWAHLISRDQTEWTESEEPFFFAPEGMGEPECPDYFHKDGFYYLVYSLRGKGYYKYSRKPFSDWQTPADPIIPCKSVPKAAVWHDRLIFAGFDGQERYAGTMTFMEALVKENGEFEYKKLD